MKNLPLEYSKLSKFFDTLSNYRTIRNRAIAKILKEHKVKTVLDLTCGTGSQLLWLAQKGYAVTGSDLSPELLKIARKKIRAEQLKIKLYHGDMRSIQVGSFDSVITIWNAIGHLSKVGFNKALKNINQNLNPGGIYIFDIFNLNAMNSAVLESFTMNLKKTVGNETLHQVQHSSLDYQKGILTSSDFYTLEKGKQKPQKFKGKFSLQIYSPKELKEMLQAQGFKVLGQYDIDGSKFSNKKTVEMLTVAQKI